MASCHDISAGMSAATAVLETCELLETIIAYLPSKQVIVAQRICWTWHKLIQSSTKIARQRVLPSRPECNILPLNGGPVVDPTYLTEERMSFHPTVSSSCIPPSNSAQMGWQYPVILKVPYHVSQNRAEAANAMLTNPPITNAPLFYTQHHSLCEMRSPAGITVKDMLEVAAAIHETELSYCKAHKRKLMHPVTVKFAVIGARPMFQGL